MVFAFKCGFKKQSWKNIPNCLSINVSLTPYTEHLTVKVKPPIMRMIYFCRGDQICNREWPKNSRFRFNSQYDHVENSHEYITMLYFMLSKYSLIHWFFYRLLKLTKIQGSK
jgi:hypothetical protein